LGMAVTTAVLSAAGIAATVGPASAATGAPYVRYGDSGRAAWCVQVGLDALDNPDLYVAEDGQFGAKTLAAVKELQRIYGLQVDGVVGPRTGQALWNAIRAEGGFWTSDLFYSYNCFYYLPTTYWG